MRTLVCTVLWLWIVSNSVLFAEESRPEGSLFGGYRFADLSGSAHGEEYEYLHDSFAWGGQANFYAYPHRFHSELDMKNGKDYFADVGEGYKDVFVFRWINRTLFHNLENNRLIDLDPATSDISVNPNDANEDYGTQVGMNSLLLKAKTPDFPFHIYADGWRLDKEGDRQQRFLHGAGYFYSNDGSPSTVRESLKRDVDQRTQRYALGWNSHLGPIEVDYAHGEERFDVHGQEVLYDRFGPSVRPAGEWPHNRIPEFKGSSDTVKVHTSYTGRLVASATLTSRDRQNQYSGAEADHFMGSGSLTWMPFTQLTFFMKYSRKEIDLDNPNTLTVVDRADPANTYGDPSIRNSVSSTTDSVSGTLRYQPITAVTLKAVYAFEDVNREHADEWDLEEKTQRRTLTLSANARVRKDLKLRARYTHEELDDPAYNVDPHRSDEGEFAVTWIPLPQVSTLVTYRLHTQERNELRFLDTTEPENREVRWDQLLADVTFMISEDLSLSTSYARWGNKVKQDLEFHDAAGTPGVDFGVPYKDDAESYAFHIHYKPTAKWSLGGGITHTSGKASFDPSRPDLLDPVSIASFSELKLRETVYSLAGDYEFKEGLRLGLDYRYSDFNDVIDNPHDDAEDGTARTLLLRVSKKW